MNGLPTRNIVTEDLQQMIVTNNQGRFKPVANVFTDQSPFLEFSFARQLILNRSVHFTKSQRDNVQLVLDDFILKKKKGPFLSRGLQVSNFLRDHCLQLFQVISWRCTVPGCPFTATTKEGSIVEGRKPHSHPARSVCQRFHFKGSISKARSGGEKGGVCQSAAAGENKERFCDYLC